MKNMMRNICGTLLIVGAVAGLTGCSGSKLALVGGENAYTIVYDADFSENGVEACEILQEYLGKDVELTPDEDEDGNKAASSKYEILVGATNRSESASLGKDLGLYDYKIDIKGKKLVLAGGSEDAAINAIATFMRTDEFKLEDGVPGSYSVFFDGADNREEYVADPDRFLCNWVLEFEVPEWMKDFEEKMAAFNDPDGRMMSCLHRGEAMNYPENSIESIISAIHMGIDNLELDVRLTKDRVPVLMHDAKISEVTDWKEKAGKDGLPTSANVADWNYDQLKELRLINEWTGEVTDYIVPTLKECLEVGNERITFTLDRKSEWEWDKDVFPLIQETKSWRTVILGAYLGTDRQTKSAATIKAEGGVDALRYASLKHDDRDQWSSQIAQLKTQDTLPIMMYNVDVGSLKSLVKIAQAQFAQIGSEVRIFTQNNALQGGSEKNRDFDFLYENGINIVMVENGIKISKYIAENFEPTPY